MHHGYAVEERMRKIIYEMIEQFPGCIVKWKSKVQNTVYSMQFFGLRMEGK